MVYLKNSNSFFKKMPPERLFASTAGAVVPKDRRLSSQASVAELRKPKPAASNDPSIVTVRPEAGQQEERLQQAYHKFAERLSSVTPISSSACSTIKGGTLTPRGGPTTPTGVAWSTTSTPRTAQGPVLRPSADSFPPMDSKPGAQFTHYDAVQQAWRKHAAGKSPVLA